MELFGYVLQDVVIAQLVTASHAMQVIFQTQIQLLASDAEPTVSRVVHLILIIALLVLQDLTFPHLHALLVVKIVLPVLDQAIHVLIAHLANTSAQVEFAKAVLETALLARQQLSVRAAEWDSVFWVMHAKDVSCLVLVVIHLISTSAHHVLRDWSQ